MTYRVQRTCTRLADGRELICCGRLQGSFQDGMPAIAGRHQAPLRAGANLWLHRQISSIRRSVEKLKYLAGSGMGARFSAVTPEATACRLRNVDVSLEGRL